MVLATNEYHLLHICDRDGGRTVSLGAATYSIGRDSCNALVLNDPKVSRHHCLLLRIPRKRNSFIYRLVDGDVHGKASKNGIRINSKRHLTKILDNQDLIQLGEYSSLSYMIAHMTQAEFDQYFSHTVVPFHSVKEEVLDPTGTLQNLAQMMEA